MKKQLNEPDFIGGQGHLTEVEEQALSIYFASKKNKATKQVHKSSRSKKRSIASHL